jgi:hypothetical protein
MTNKCSNPQEERIPTVKKRENGRISKMNGLTAYLCIMTLGTKGNDKCSKVHRARETSGVFLFD